MGSLNLDLNNVNLDSNFDEYDPFDSMNLMNLTLEIFYVFLI